MSRSVVLGNSFQLLGTEDGCHDTEIEEAIGTIPWLASAASKSHQAWAARTVSVAAKAKPKAKPAEDRAKRAVDLLAPKVGVREVVRYGFVLAFVAGS